MLHDLARRFRGQGHADVEVDLVAPGLAAAWIGSAAAMAAAVRESFSSASTLTEPAVIRILRGMRGARPPRYASARSSAVRRATSRP